VTDIRLVLKIKLYRTILLPVVLFGCETWSISLKFGTWEILRERDHLGDRSVDGRIILRWILKEVVCGGYELDWAASG
jgi:hypothetical protein